MRQHPFPVTDLAVRQLCARHTLQAIVQGNGTFHALQHTFAVPPVPCCPSVGLPSFMHIIRLLCHCIFVCTEQTVACTRVPQKSKSWFSIDNAVGTAAAGQCLSL